MVYDGHLNETALKNKGKELDCVKTVDDEREIILGNNKYSKQSDDKLYVCDLYYV